LNSRERFLTIMNFERPDRDMFWEFGYWAGTVRRWYGEGLPYKFGIPSREEVTGGQTVLQGDDELPDGRGIFHSGLMGFWWSPFDQDIMASTGMDPGPRQQPVNYWLSPRFEERMLEDHGDWYLWADAEGCIKRELKDRTTLPQVLSWSVSNREDWEQIKAERLRPTLEGRLPDNWTQMVQELKARNYPLIIGSNNGFYGTPRKLLGPENVLFTFHDDPELIKDINNYLVDFWIALYDQVLDQIDADCALIWEDMCYKAGPLISPAMFREFMLPQYKKLTSFLRDRGVKIILVDTDGDCRRLLPLFIEGGVTGLFPFEVTGGMDIVQVRKSFPRLQIIGGLDKTKVAAGRRTIDEELEAKVPFMLEQGGYVACLDHSVPPDISWGNFAHYRDRLKEMILAAAQNGAEPR
jgi:Uroporphyrinogen decarboxylase (URO-D)